MFCRREKKTVQVEEAVAFWEGGFSDGDVITKIDPRNFRARLAGEEPLEFSIFL